jgi:hypothetical protein
MQYLVPMCSGRSLMVGTRCAFKQGMTLGTALVLVTLGPIVATFAACVIFTYFDSRS